MLSSVKILGALLTMTLLGSGAFAQPLSPKQIRQRPLLRQVDPKIREIFWRLVVAERTVSYLAREIVVDKSGRAQEMWVKYDPKRGVRRESITSPGDLSVDDSKHVWQLQARQRKLIERESGLVEQRKRLLDALGRIGRQLQVSLQGQDTVASRTADILLIQPPIGVTGPSRRLWIDRETGLRLRTEEHDAEGRIVSSAYFLSLELSPSFKDDDFAPIIASKEITVVKDIKRKFATFDEAAKSNIFPKQPSWLPMGFTLRSIIATQNGSWTTTRWGNDLTVLSLLQARGKLPQAIKKQLSGAESGLFVSQKGDKNYAWANTESYFVLIGNLPEDQLKRIAESVK
jgi:hypothetical protein